MDVLQLNLQGSFLDGSGQVPLTISIILLIIGFLFCFIGYRALKVILFLTGSFVGGALMTYFWPGIFPMILGALIGRFVAVGLYVVGIFILGAILGMFIVNLFFLPIGVESPIFITLVIGIIGGVFAIYLQRAIIIIATAIYGSGMMVNGFDLMLSGGKIFSPLQPFDVGSFSIVHVVLAIALAIGGMLIQFGTTSEPQKQETQTAPEPKPQPGK